MKNNNGFTLIELLAVIVILAIVALIATPMILNVISDSRDSSLTSTMKNYTKALEDAVIFGQMGISSSTTEIATGIYLYNEISDINGVTFTGEAPSDGWIAFDNDLNVIAGMLYFKKLNSQKYVIYYDEKTAVRDYNDSPSTIGDAPASVSEAISITSAIVNN